MNKHYLGPGFTAVATIIIVLILVATFSTAQYQNVLRITAGNGIYISPTQGIGNVTVGVGSTNGQITKVTAASGTGVTVNEAGKVNRLVYKVTIARTAFVENATTSDKTIATLPAKTRLVSIIADLTQTFACTDTCTSSTLSITVGKSTGGAEYLVSFDADATAARFGLADADLGTSINRANAIQGGDLNSWTATTTVSMRMTSGTGALGTGAATHLSQGSVTFYLETETMP